MSDFITPDLVWALLNISGLSCRSLPSINTSGSCGGEKHLSCQISFRIVSLFSLFITDVVKLNAFLQ